MEVPTAVRFALALEEVGAEIERAFMEKGVKMPELKPCPFCGNENISAAQHKMFGQDVRYTIKCMRCMGEMTRSTKKKAEQAWNRRVTKDEEPTIDAVPVVRCKDCKYYEPSGLDKKPRCWNTFWNSEFFPETNPDDFCSCGERKE